MTETLTIRRERVDDIPVLLAQLDRMGVQPLLDEQCSTHGNGVGLSLGWVTVLWLTHLLSEADHRLNHGEPWAAPRLHTLQGSIGPRRHPLDLSDDRLAAVLEALSHDEPWQAFEGAFTQPWLGVYDLPPERVRLDSPAASGYWRVTEDGLLQCGHSKDHRPDLPQVKVMLAVLAPLGLPVATDVVPGQRADDPLYIPAITRVRESVGRCGLLDGGRLPDGGAGDPGMAPGWWRRLPVPVGGGPTAACHVGGVLGAHGDGTTSIDPHHAPDRHRHTATPRRRLRTTGDPDRGGGVSRRAILPTCHRQ